jgi:glyoxylase-like metal-dependent hydrolase (beta-lactamase superfamily II)
MNVSRRSFLSLTSAAVAGIAAHPSLRLLAQGEKQPTAFMQQARDAAAKAALQGKMLRGDVGVVMGAGGNVGVLKSAGGGLVIDSGFASSADHLWQQLNLLGVDKVPMLINTHWHFDHTDGNAALHQRGARILAHERTRYWLQRDTAINIPKAFEVGFVAAPAAALPQDVMTTTRTLHHGAETIEITHYPAAHTDSDMAIVFKQANVVHTGDLFFNGFYPLIDSGSGPSSSPGTGRSAPTRSTRSMSP